MWVGQRESLEEMAALTGIECRPLAELPAALTGGLDVTEARIVRDVDDRVTKLLDELRRTNDVAFDPCVDEELAVMLSEMRLIKDDYEIGQLQKACDDTAAGLRGRGARPAARRRGRTR